MTYLSILEILPMEKLITDLEIIEYAMDFKIALSHLIEGNKNKNNIKKTNLEISWKFLITRLSIY